jgi:DeoR family transcriptional regulator of aga operon
MAKDVKKKEIKDKSLSTPERRNEILQNINNNGSASVEELVKRFGVSSVTIRNDLNYLEERGFIHRTYGGAMTRDFVAFDSTQKEKAKHHVEEKKRIGAAAADLIFDGDSIILDSGTTTLAIARNIKTRKNLTVMTNAINIAVELAGIAGITVMLTGGTLREKSFSLVGPHAESVLKEFYFDKLFLGVDGFDIHFGLTTPNLLEAQLNRMMVDYAKEVIVVVDSSKFRRRSLSVISTLERIHKVITDKKIPQDCLAALRDRSIEVTLV